MLCLRTPCTKLLALGVATHGHTHTDICEEMAPVMDIVPASGGGQKGVSRGSEGGLKGVSRGSEAGRKG
eukprot:5442355-Pyramimonas_sp.AAC.1